jgi:hypothetical protein
MTLEEAHDEAWRAQRHDECARIIKAIRAARETPNQEVGRKLDGSQGHSAPRGRPWSEAEELQRDFDEEAEARGITTADLLRSGA